jgi:predicted branched-subunit amino acid permease
MNPVQWRGPASVWRDPACRLGARDMAVAAAGLGAWGLVTGVAMTKSGLGLPLALAMTLLVYAGSAQLTALPLLVAGAPVWLIAATAFCVNLRFVIFSVQWRRLLGGLPRRQRIGLAYLATDNMLALSTARFRDQPPDATQVAYFVGGGAVNWAAWQASSIAGILLGEAIPPAWGLQFAGTLSLLAVACALVRDRLAVACAAVAAAVALAAQPLPLRLNLVAAIAAAVVAGLLIERLLRRRPTAAGGLQ